MTMRLRSDEPASPEAPDEEGLFKSLISHATFTGRSIKSKLGKTVNQVQENVDPVAVGGAVVTMSAGELIGGALGGALGAVGGPPGVALGSSLGAFAGSSIGSKLGYDLTHEVIHADDAHSAERGKGRVEGAVKSLVSRAGDVLGGAAGAAGGGVLGGAVAGSLGGTVGAVVGETLAAEAGENSMHSLYRYVSQDGSQSHSLGAGNHTHNWLKNTTFSAVAETGASLTLSTTGALLAGEWGRRLGEHSALVAVKRIHWGTIANENNNPTEEESQ